MVETHESLQERDSPNLQTNLQGSNTTSHGGASSVDSEGLAVCGAIATGRSDVSYCRCGCGAILRRNSAGKMPLWIKNHWTLPSRSKVEWLHLLADKNSEAPFCKCGCGRKCFTQFKYRKSKINGIKPFYAFLYGHDKRPQGWNLALSKEERQAILGTLLGDCSIGYPNKRSQTPRLATTHGLVQKEWAEHKVSFLARLNMQIETVENKGYGKWSVRFHSSCLPCLLEIESIVRCNGIKRVSREWLDQIGDLGLAWWFCDDGSAGKKGGTVSFHTEGYSEEENELIADWFIDKSGYGACPYANGRGHWFVGLDRDASCWLIRHIRNYVPASMQYKMDAVAKHRAGKYRASHIRSRNRSYPLLFRERDSRP